MRTGTIALLILFSITACNKNNTSIPPQKITFETIYGPNKKHVLNGWIIVDVRDHPYIDSHWRSEQTYVIDIVKNNATPSEVTLLIQPTDRPSNFLKMTTPSTPIKNCSYFLYKEDDENYKEIYFDTVNNVIAKYYETGVGGLSAYGLQDTRWYFWEP